jgi:hypothetical protein
VAAGAKRPRRSRRALSARRLLWDRLGRNSSRFDGAASTAIFRQHAYKEWAKRSYLPLAVWRIWRFCSKPMTLMSAASDSMPSFTPVLGDIVCRRHDLRERDPLDISASARSNHVCGVRGSRLDQRTVQATAQQKRPRMAKGPHQVGAMPLRHNERHRDAVIFTF